MTNGTLGSPLVTTPLDLVKLSGPGHIGTARFHGPTDVENVYDDRLRLQSRIYTQGATTIDRFDYRHDNDSRLRIEKRDSSDNAYDQSRYHELDARARLTGTWQNVATFPALTAGTSQTINNSDIIAWDAQATAGAETFAFGYNNADERLTSKEGANTRTYTYAAGHELDKSTLSGVDEEASHFADGPFKTLGARTFMTDGFGRVTKVDSDTIFYDAFGRMSEMSPPQRAKQCYFGNELWEERLVNNNDVWRQFTQHSSLGLTAIHSAASATSTTLHDKRQNMTTTVNEAGTVNRRYLYEPFGTPNASSTLREPYFGGMRWSSSRSLYYSQTRIQSPKHGMWMSRDGLGVIDSPNTYAYVAQNPLNFIDPSGLSKEDNSTVSPIAPPGATQGKQMFYLRRAIYAVLFPDWDDIRLNAMARGIPEMYTSITDIFDVSAFMSVYNTSSLEGRLKSKVRPEDVRYYPPQAYPFEWLNSMSRTLAVAHSPVLAHTDESVEENVRAIGAATDPFVPSAFVVTFGGSGIVGIGSGAGKTFKFYLKGRYAGEMHSFLTANAGVGFSVSATVAPGLEWFTGQSIDIDPSREGDEGVFLNAGPFDFGYGAVSSQANRYIGSTLSLQSGFGFNLSPVAPFKFGLAGGGNYTYYIGRVF